MTTRSTFVAAQIFCAVLLTNDFALAKADYYVVDSFGDAVGYAEIEISSDGLVSGRVCAYKEGSLDPPRERSILGTIKVSGQKDRSLLKLQFTPESTDTSSSLKNMLPRGLVTLFPREVNYFDTLLNRSTGWETRSGQKNEIKVELSKMPDSLSAPSSDRYANIIIGNNEKTFDLARFDNVSPAQALSLIPAIKWNDIVAPSYVPVVYRPKDRDAVVQYLRTLSAAVRLVDPPLPDCGSPLVEDTIRVPSTLEFYFSRQLQNSGLVVRAYPYVIPKTPPFRMVTLRAPALVAGFRNELLDLDQKDFALASFFESELKEFLAARRPAFREPWEITRRNSGALLAYRVQITGAAISQCQKAGWEQFDIQILLMSYGGGFSVYLQAVEGFQAPGALSERPPDSRFKDNPLPDARLEKIQDFFVDFLIRRGIAEADSLDKRVSEGVCRL